MKTGDRTTHRRASSIMVTEQYFCKHCKRTKKGGDMLYTTKCYKCHSRIEGERATKNRATKEPEKYATCEECDKIWAFKVLLGVKRTVRFKCHCPKCGALSDKAVDQETTHYIKIGA